MHPLESFGGGVLAGLALAVPLGGIGVLLLREGSLHGIRRAMPAAAAVATVDTLYCVLAIAVGAAAVPVLSRLGPWPATLGGGVLVVLAVSGIVKGLRATAAASPTTAHGSGRRWTTFFLLTLINPATLVYFAAVTTGLGEVTAGWGAALTFVAGVGLSSWGWQSLLVVAGGLLGKVTTPAVQRATSVLGSALVGALGVVVVVTAWG